MSTKRRRGAQGARVARVSAARPIDKLLVAISKDAVAGTQVSSVLYTATFPATITGLRWSLSFLQDAGTAEGEIYWALIVVRDGLSASTIATSDTAAFYEPEQDVLAFGVTMYDNNTESKIMEGATKTMRKLKGGDQLVFISKGVATDTAAVRGVVQFFAKS